MRLTIPRVALLGLATIVVGLSTPAWAQGEPPRDLSSIRFDGQRYFSSDDLRWGLASSPDLALAAYHTNPLDQYLGALEQRAVVGYQRAGFANAAVRATREQDQILIWIVEGVQTRFGKVIVSGERGLNAKQIARKLIEPDAPGGVAPWQAGEPARYDNQSIRQYTALVKRACAEQGYFFPKLHVANVPTSVPQIADLLVSIDAEGPPGVLARIEFAGLERNSQIAVQDLLGVEVGGPIYPRILEGAKERLADAGRFYESTVNVLPPAPGQNGVALLVTVVEIPDLPPIDAELSPLEKALLNCHGWILDQLRSGQSDLVIDARARISPLQPLDARVVLSSRDGGLVHLRHASPERRGETLAAYAVSPRGLSMFNFDTGRKCLVPPGNSQFKFSLSMKPIDPKDPEHEGQDESMSFGMALATSDTPVTQPIQLNLDLSPAVFLRMAHSPTSRYDLRDGTLTIDGADFRMRIEATTGRLIDWLIRGDEQIPVLVRIAPGGLAGELADLDSAARGLRNVYDQENSFTSVLAYVGRDALDLLGLVDGVDPRSLDAWERLIVGGMLSDDGNSEWNHDQPDESPRFVVPSEIVLDDESLTAFLLPLTAGLANMLPDGVWPQRLAQQSAFVLSGRPDLLGDELAELIRTPSTGPIGILALAKSFELLSPEIAGLSSQLGVERLAVDDFRRDYGLLLDNPLPLIQHLLRRLGRLAELDDADVELLAAALGPHEQRAFRRLVEILRQAPVENHRAALAAWLDEYWERRLRDVVAARFRAYMDESPLDEDVLRR